VGGPQGSRAACSRGELGDEDVFERRGHFAQLPDGHAAAREMRSQRRRGIHGRGRREPHVHAIAERLDVLHSRHRPRGGDERLLAGSADFDDAAREAGAECARRVEREHAAFVQQRHARAALGLVEIGRADHDRDALVEELGQQLPELAARDRIDPGRGLVEQDEPRFVHERAGERELLFHAAGQPVGQAGSERAQAGEREQAVAPGGVLPHAVDLGEERDVLVDAQVAVQAEPLREVTDLPRQGHMLAGGIAAEHLHAAGILAQQAADHADDRRLSRTVRADQPEHPAARHAHRHAVEGAHGAESLDDLVEGDGIVGHDSTGQ
jgi:hypothetical protein